MKIIILFICFLTIVRGGPVASSQKDETLRNNAENAIKGVHDLQNRLFQIQRQGKLLAYFGLHNNLRNSANILNQDTALIELKAKLNEKEDAKLLDLFSVVHAAANSYFDQMIEGYYVEKINLLDSAVKSNQLEIETIGKALEINLENILKSCKKHPRNSKIKEVLIILEKMKLELNEIKDMVTARNLNLKPEQMKKMAHEAVKMKIVSAININN